MAGGPAGGSGAVGPRPGRAWRARPGFGARVRPCGRLTRMNRLAGATSPYRLQRADNPVDWWPWGPKAFEGAKRHDVPVLLPVGYSACHWRQGV
ncbi:DUF255 domain-containing protein [Streptomyces sp. NPDC093085]|uniref:DUF255 domain-containing protein n=1 Tax=Streptomyces sp. NPDC093085 TaxID=3155068 RepID=UPI003427904C